MIARKFLTLLLTLFLFVIAGPAVADRGDDHHDDSKKLDVMTANLYLGADIFRIVGATDIPGTVAEVFGIVQATNFPERAQTIADDIMKRRPHVIGLQEVSWYQTGPYNGGLNADTTVYDFLELLMNAIAARGLDYRVAGVITNADVEAPMYTNEPPYIADLRLTDRDVILVRGDVHSGTPYAKNYQLNAGFELIPGVPESKVEFTRGLVMVPVKVRGHWYLVVNTHLETRLDSLAPDSQARVIQFAQAAELAGTVDYMNTNVYGDLPVVLVGDLNSDPNDQPVEVEDWAHGAPLYIPEDIYFLVPPYMVLASYGYTDTWLARKGRRDSGETCCHDERLDNADENFYERIDHVLFKNSDPSMTLGPIQAEVINDSHRDKTASGLWASDHGFVSTRIKLKSAESEDSDDDDDDDDDHNHRKGKH